MSSIRLEGDLSKLINRLSKLENFQSRISGINAVLGETLRESTLERFKDGQSPNGSNWESSIRVNNDGGKTLIDNADLKNSIRTKASSTGFAIGTNKIYAATHQYGDERTIRAKTVRGLRFKIGNKFITKQKVIVTIPARPFIGISEEDMIEIRDTLESIMEE